MWSYEEEREAALAFEALTEAEVIYLEEAAYVREVGAAHPECAWIGSDRDVLYPNPFYTGPRVPHPDDSWDEGDE